MATECSLVSFELVHDGQRDRNVSQDIQLPFILL